MEDTTPVTVHLPAKRVADIQTLVDRGKEESVANWVKEAVEEKAYAEHLGENETLGDICDEIALRTGGPFTEEEMEWARRRLDF